MCREEQHLSYWVCSYLPQPQAPTRDTAMQAVCLPTKRRNIYRKMMFEASATRLDPLAAPRLDSLKGCMRLRSSSSAIGCRDVGSSPQIQPHRLLLVPYHAECLLSCWNHTLHVLRVAVHHKPATDPLCERGVATINDDLGIRSWDYRAKVIFYVSPCCCCGTELVCTLSAARLLNSLRLNSG